jgi:hypothetical protein
LGLVLAATSPHAQDTAPAPDAVTESGKPSKPKKGPHGGQVSVAGDYQIEFVTAPAGFRLYILNKDGQTLSVGKAEAAATIMHSFGSRKMVKFKRHKDEYFFTSLPMNRTPDFTLYVKIRNGPIDLNAEFQYKMPAAKKVAPQPSSRP